MEQCPRNKYESDRYLTEWIGNEIESNLSEEPRHFPESSFDGNLTITSERTTSAAKKNLNEIG
jgi:hypothetical protein